MNAILQFLSASDPLVQIAAVIFALFAGWILLRFLLRAALRILSLGCILLVVVGVVLVVLGYFR